ncbi:MAG TPA: hypothetical protein VFS25_05295 [Chitinophaga sp.]|uniref:hypothetical protein n=1 Tax=Chitinophaga sp. TaxID=1869181 RepID=UPI002DB75344|nr:hypothetical protein [Chitinophaga sp.]HEU4552223.1 hypothetical protein [Chitinophaga sp.]
MILWIALAAVVVQFAVFKWFYPFASFIHGDSFVYIDIAHKNSDIESYMVGYGRFLRLFSVFTTSDTILVAFQYLFMQCSALFLLFTLFYFYRFSKVLQMILLCFIVLNPLFLYMGNLISSDGLFLGLSLIWFTLLLWTLHNPGTKVLLANIAVLFFAFTVRYNALIYPLITAVVILACRLPTRKKLASIGIGFLFCGLFMLYTGNKYKALTGTWQYSPFGGWLMANNAMYAYRYVDSADRKPVPERFRKLDNMIRSYFDSTRDVKKFPLEAVQASTFYMWSPGLPLYAYRDTQFKKDTVSSELKKWASMGPFYKAYGMYIISQYPLYYARYFLWPNANKYYAPPVEFLGLYNSGYDQVTLGAKQWFDYKSTKVKTRAGSPVISVLDFYPITSGVINVVMLCGLICFAMVNGFGMSILYRKGIILAGSIWLLNAGFTIFASSAALRFQAFPIILTTVFTLSLIDYLVKIGRQEAEEKRGTRMIGSSGTVVDNTTFHSGMIAGVGSGDK